MKRKEKEATMTELVGLTIGCTILWLQKLAGFYHKCRYLLLIAVVIWECVALFHLIAGIPCSLEMILFFMWALLHMLYISIYEEFIDQ